MGQWEGGKIIHKINAITQFLSVNHNIYRHNRSADWEAGSWFWATHVSWKSMHRCNQAMGGAGRENESNTSLDFGFFHSLAFLTLHVLFSWAFGTIQYDSVSKPEGGSANKGWNHKHAQIVYFLNKLFQFIFFVLELVKNLLTDFT